MSWLGPFILTLSAWTALVAATHTPIGHWLGFLAVWPVLLLAGLIQTIRFALGLPESSDMPMLVGTVIAFVVYPIVRAWVLYANGNLDRALSELLGLSNFVGFVIFSWVAIDRLGAAWIS